MKSTANRKTTILGLIGIAIFAAGLFFFFWKAPRQETIKNEPNIAATSITAQIVSELKYSDLTEVPAQQLSKHYEIPGGLIVDSSVYMSTSANVGNELACFRLLDPSDYSELERCIVKHIGIKAQGFKELNPTEYDKIQKYRIEQHGSYVLMVIGDNADAAFRIFNVMIS